jgi:hypothetical protein
MTILMFNLFDHLSGKIKWHPVEEAPPGPGDFLASDGVKTWVMRRETNHPIAPFSRVKWWREVIINQESENGPQ